MEIEDCVAGYEHGYPILIDMDEMILPGCQLVILTRVKVTGEVTSVANCWDCKADKFWKFYLTA